MTEKLQFTAEDYYNPTMTLTPEQFRKYRCWKDNVQRLMGSVEFRNEVPGEKAVEAAVEMERRIHTREKRTYNSDPLTVGMLRKALEEVDGEMLVVAQAFTYRDDRDIDVQISDGKLFIGSGSEYERGYRNEDREGPDRSLIGRECHPTIQQMAKAILGEEGSDPHPV